MRACGRVFVDRDLVVKHIKFPTKMQKSSNEKEERDANECEKKNTHTRKRKGRDERAS